MGVRNMARLCPMCGNRMPKEDSKNSLSRYYDVYICSTCGNLEAMRDFHGMKPIRPSEWAVNPIMLISMNDGKFFEEDIRNGYIVSKYDPGYRSDLR